MLSNIRPNEKYEILVFRRNIYRNQLIKALDEVKKYIIDKKLILTGGMAIDLALRKKGYKLYEDDTLPDYDFYSPDFQNDAYAIGKKLCEMKLDNISVIAAAHSTTMRVRVNIEPVADITYIPQDLYSKIPTIKHKEGILIEHPHYKMINMHTSLSYPYSQSPRDVILERFDKDMCRFDILYKVYPIKNINIKERIITKKIGRNVLNGECLSGFAALYYWASKQKKDKDILVNKSIDIEFKIPDSAPISILSDDPEKTRRGVGAYFKDQGITSSQNYNEILDNIPARIEIYLKNKHIVDIFDNRGNLTAATKVGDLWVANPQFIMSQFLAKYFMYDEKPEDKIKYIWGYLLCFNLVKTAADNYSKGALLTTSKGTPEIKKEAPEIKKGEVGAVIPDLLPTYTVFGKYNINKSNISREHLILEKIGEIPKRVHSERPINIFPKLEKGCKVGDKVKNFVVKKSWMFKVDGSKRNTPLEFVRD